jgi:maltoporin
MPRPRRGSAELQRQSVNPKDSADVTPDPGSTTSPNRTLTKVTLAPTLVAGNGFWGRPEIRAFVTYAHWNDAAKQRGVTGNFTGFGTCDPNTTTRPFGCDNDGVTFGAQVEAWW